MTPYYEDDMVTLWHGDCRQVMSGLGEASVDSIVTDPPYGLEFMGNGWDSFAPQKATLRSGWDEANASARISKEGATGHGRVAFHKRRQTFECRTCGKRDGFRNAHSCQTADWQGIWVDDLPLESLAFGEWTRQWAVEAYRVLKPGGHLLAFGGTRTWHRLAVAIEDAGFEIRDSIAWMYGSGFPKSLDVSKAIDRRRDDRDDVLRVTSEIARLRDMAGLSNRDLDDAFGFAGMAGHWTSTKSQPTVPTVQQWAVLRDMLNPDEWLDAEVWRLNGRKGQPGEAWAKREITGQHEMPAAGQQWNANYGLPADLTAKERRDKPATSAAQQWQGWGTALKPAFEPIVIARKPLIGTVAENVLAHGTGALNIDGCRIAASDPFGGGAKATSGFVNGYEHDGWHAGSDKGRWPANVILDESQAAELDKQSGTQRDGVAIKRNGVTSNGVTGWGKAPVGTPDLGYGGEGGASRFFYTAKANSSERPRVDGVAHPTVKPLDLMRYLVRLVTPPGGTVLEPFAGSGTTLEACVMEGFHAIGIELTDEYLPLIRQRLSKPIEQVLL